jgi:hypothetical protein
MLPGAFTGVSRTIVGVLPAGYAPFGFSPDLLTPLIVDATEPSYRSLGELTVIGRLLNDEPLAAVSAAIESRLRSLPDFAGSDPLPPIAAVPLREALIGDQRSSLGLALGAVLLVLTIACANVAHLSLARLTSRQRELAVQTALGASRGRLARQLLAESFVVCCAGAVVGLGVAWLALPPIGRALPASFGASELPLDARVLGFLVLVLGVTTLVAGAWPAMRRVPAIGPALSAERSPSSEDPAGWLGLHQGLIIAEVALAVVLVTSAGLILASLDRMMNVDPGFSPDGVTTGRFSPSDSRSRVG